MFFVAFHLHKKLFISIVEKKSDDFSIIQLEKRKCVWFFYYFFPVHSHWASGYIVGYISKEPSGELLVYPQYSILLAELVFFWFLRDCLLASLIDCFTFLGFSVKTKKALLFFSRFAEPLHSESQSTKHARYGAFFSSTRRYKKVQWRSLSISFRLRGSSAKSIAKKTNFCLGFQCFHPLKYFFYTSANRMFVPVRSTNR